MNRLFIGLMIMSIFLGGCVLSNNQLRCAGSEAAQVGSVENGLAISGITGDGKAYAKITTSPGEGINFFTCGENTAIVNGRLDQPLGGSGSVALWFKAAKQFRSTFGDESVSQRFVTIDGLCRIGFYGKDPGDNCPAIYLHWDKSITGVRDIVALLPEIPAGSDLHIAFAWDCEKGLANAYINGTPLRPMDSTTPWQLQNYSNISVYGGSLPVADIRIYDSYLTTAQVRNIMGGRHIGIMDRYLGLTDLGTIEQARIDSLKGSLFYSNPLEKASDIEGWKMEGPGKTEFKNGAMVMESLMADKGTDVQGHIVNWCDKDMPENFIAQWDYQLQSKYGLTIAFFCAKGVNGEDIFNPNLAPRDGTFGAYIKGDINNYHISYQAEGPDGGVRRTSHIRKNSGFALASNGPVGIDGSSKAVHKAVLIKNGGHIQMTIDGKIIIDFTEDGKLGAALGSGKIGFRQMKWTRAAYRNFEVYTINEPSTDKPKG